MTRTALLLGILVAGSPLVSNAQDPFSIEVPVLTRKERLHLDQFMPQSDPDWAPSEFEMDMDDLQAYRSIYRFNPIYAELLT